MFCSRFQSFCGENSSCSNCFFFYMRLLIFVYLLQVSVAFLYSLTICDVLTVVSMGSLFAGLVSLIFSVPFIFAYMYYSLLWRFFFSSCWWSGFYITDLGFFSSIRLYNSRFGAISHFLHVPFVFKNFPPIFITHFSRFFTLCYSPDIISSPLFILQVKLYFEFSYLLLGFQIHLHKVWVLVYIIIAFVDSVFQPRIFPFSSFLCFCFLGHHSSFYSF